MNIRKFAESDKDKLITLWQSVFPDDPPHNKPARVIADKLAIDDLIFIAEANGELIGACMAGYDGHRGWLYAVAVEPTCRREGVGAKLVKYAIKNLKQRGCIKVNLQIRSTNTVVADFYKALGFSVEDRLSMGRFID